MSRQPWMKFYPADWRADPALRSCSLAARGLWMEMLAIMHEAEPRGHLLINGQSVSVQQLASLTGAVVYEVEALLSELDRSGVFSRKKNGVVFSRRMERDENRTRKMRENGKLGGNPSLCSKTKNPALDNLGDKTQKPEARGQKKANAFYKARERAEMDQDFEAFWAAYPRKAGKGQAEKTYRTARQDGASAPDILAGAIRYAAERSGQDPKFTRMPATWLNGKGWLDEAANVVPIGRPRDLRDIKDPVDRARAQSF